MVEFTLVQVKERTDELNMNADEFNVCPCIPEGCVVKGRTEELSNKKSNYEIRLSKTIKISINKPLIVLKVCIFLLLGSVFQGPFINVLYKQKGISASELSMMYIVAPAVQIVMTLFIGVMIDKFGKVKHVFAVLNGALILTKVAIIFLPPTDISSTCENEHLNIHCVPKNLTNFHFFSENLTNLNNSSPTFHSEDQVNMSFINKSRESTNNESFLYLCDKSNHDQLFHNRTWCEKLCNKSCLCGVCERRGLPREVLVAFYGMVFVVHVTFVTVSFRMMDVLAMSMVKDHGGDYGRQRFFGICGNLILSALAGFLVDLTTPEQSPKNYSAALYFVMLMNAVLILLVYRLDVKIIRSEAKIGKLAFTLFKNPDVLVFVLILLTLGTSRNFRSAYSFWFLESFKPPALLLGLQDSLISLYSLPVVLTAQLIMRKLGVPTILVMAHLAHGIYFLAFSYLTNPWISLVIISTVAVSYHLLWVAVLEYAVQLAPEGMTSLAIAMAGGIHFNASKSVMGLTGGQVLSAYGERTAFRFMAVVCGIGGTLSAIYYSVKLIRMKKSQKKEPMDN